MPTVIEPKSEKEVTPQLVSPSREPELFAAEIEMEKKSLNIFPIILILGLVAVVGGTIFYFVKGARDVLTGPVATTAISNILKMQGPATVHFKTGKVEASINGGHEPQYKLLEKAGVIAANAAKGKTAASLTVNITGPGETLLYSIDGVTKAKNADGATTYTVPLAVRQLVSVDKITMVKPHLAQVAYTWKWVPNRLGKEFDASGSLVQSFSSWDRATLIKSYGVDFYNAAPTKSSIVLMEGDNGAWKPYTE